MKIEVGKKYRSRHGKVYGPVQAEPADDRDPFYKFRARGNEGWVHWSEDGKFYEGLDEHFLDLVEEVT